MESKSNISILSQAKSLVNRDLDIVANMANICALIMATYNYHWVGFYLVRNEQLEIGPYQGPVACSTIQKGKGVCGSAWEEARTIVVDDVHQFPGHIACSPYSNSEIVIPCIRNNKVFAVFDIDSVEYGAFTETEKSTFEAIIALL